MKKNGRPKNIRLFALLLTRHLIFGLVHPIFGLVHSIFGLVYSIFGLVLQSYQT